MTTYAADAFTDANGTLLTSHTPTTGGPWVVDFLPSTATAPTIHSNALLTHQAEGNEQCLRLVPVGGASAQTDYQIVGTVVVQYAALSDTQAEVMLAGRMKAGGYNGYAFTWYRNGAFVLRKYRNVGLSQNYFQVASSSQPTLADGTYTYTLVFITNGSGYTEITAKVGSTVVIDAWTDTGSGYEAIQATGDAGLLAWNIANPSTAATAPIYLTDITVSSVPAGAQKLGLTQAPGGAVPAVAFERQPIVALKDYYGVTQTGVADTITVSKVSGPGALSGTVAQAVNTVTGLATWTNLQLSVAGSYVLRFTSATYGTLDTVAFTVYTANALYGASFHGQAMTDAGMTALDGGALVKVYTGSAPAAITDAVTGTLLATMTLGTYGLANFMPTWGCSSVIPPAMTTALANGTPGYARVLSSGGTALIQMNAPGVFAMGAVTIGQRVQLEYLTLTDSLGVITAATQMGGLVAVGGTMSGPAELPRVYIDTTPPTTTVTKTVGLSGRDYADLQTAVNAAAASGAAWKLLIDNGYDYTPPGGVALNLPAKTGTNWVVLSAATMPCIAGVRVTPASAATANLPKIRLANATNAVATTSGSTYYRLQGLEVLPAASSPPASAFQLINIQPDNNTPGGQGLSYADMPHHIVIDRCYLHADGVVGVSNMVCLNGDSVALIDSYLSGNVSETFETHGVGGWMPQGPWKITNNYIESIAENVILCGAESLWPGVVPSDIEIRYNTLAKDPAWHGVNFYTKTLFEMKGGCRAQIEGNELKYNWEGNKGWYGSSMTFKTVNQNGEVVPYWRLSDVTCRYNRIQYSGGMVNVHPMPEYRPGTTAARIHFSNNLAVHMGDSPATGVRKWAISLGGAPRYTVTDLTVDHCTYVAPSLGGTAIQCGDVGLPFVRTIIKNNVLCVGGINPVTGSGTGYVDEALALFFGASSSLAKNVTSGYGYEASGLPVGAQAAGNTWLINSSDGTFAEQHFTNLAGDDYSLTASAPGHLYGTDGLDSGVDMVALLAALAGHSLGDVAGSVPAPWFRHHKNTRPR